MSDTLLKYRSDAGIPASGVFNAAETFRLGETVDGIVLGWIGEHFREHLLSVQENAREAATLREYLLTVDAADRTERGRFYTRGGIIDERGGQDRVRIALGQFWTRLTSADRSLWYAAYVTGHGGITCGVHAGWMHAGLHIESGPVNRPYRWGAGAIFLLP